MHRIYLPDRYTYGQFTFMCFRRMLTAVGAAATHAPRSGARGPGRMLAGRRLAPPACRPGPRLHDYDPPRGSHRPPRAPLSRTSSRGQGDGARACASGQGRSPGLHLASAGWAQLNCSPGPASARRPILGCQATNSLTRTPAPSSREQVQSRQESSELRHPSRRGDQPHPDKSIFRVAS